MPRRPSPQTQSVLTALADEPQAWRHGYELGKQLGLEAGTLYPILMRLCDRGLLEAAWESDPPPGRPRRHLYRITAAGEQARAEARGVRTGSPAAQQRAPRARHIAPEGGR